MVRIGKSKRQIEESSSEEEDQDEESDIDEDLSEEEEEEEIQQPIHIENEIVWAKVRGHAWWPAKIGKIIEPNAAI